MSSADDQKPPEPPAGDQPPEGEAIEPPEVQPLPPPKPSTWAAKQAERIAAAKAKEEAEKQEKAQASEPVAEEPQEEEPEGAAPAEEQEPEREEPEPEEVKAEEPEPEEVKAEEPEAEEAEEPAKAEEASEETAEPEEAEAEATESEEGEGEPAEPDEQQEGAETAEEPAEAEKAEKAGETETPEKVEAEKPDEAPKPLQPPSKRLFPSKPPPPPQPIPAAPLGAEPGTYEGALPPAEGGLPPGMIVPPGAVPPAPIMGEEPPPHAGQGMWWRFFAASFLIVVSVATATSTSLLLYLSDIARGLGRGENLVEVKQDLADVTGGGEPQTIMIIGSDRRYGDKKAGIPARSDTVLLLRLDPYKKAIAIFSLPRDLKVNIPGHGPDKLNIAYALGGPKLTLKVVKQLTGLEVNHLVNVNFRGFRRAVDAIDCVYIDVDRRYYNSNLGKPAAAQYAEIDLKPGYQKLCGRDALDYVRYRHTDNDLVRAARQQDFLRQARQKIGPGRLLRDRNQLIDIFTRYTTSDIDDAQTMLSVLKLFLAAREEPIREIHFKGELGESYVTSSERQIRDAVEAFLGTRATAGPRGLRKRPAGARKKRRRSDPTKGARVYMASDAGKQQASLTQPKLAFPVYYPKFLEQGSTYSQTDAPRTYDLYDPAGRKHRAYKLVIRTYYQEYYGVMGTDWRDPPILRKPSERRRLGNRVYLVYYNGDRVRLIAWKTKRASYWLSNTLLNTLTKREMFAIAKSMKPAIP